MCIRDRHYADLSWQPYLIVAEVGAVVILGGILATIAQLVVSIRTREARRDLTGDPWDARTLEWSTSSPPPAYNFAVLPNVDSLDAFWAMKQRGPIAAPEQYEPIEVPRNSAKMCIRDSITVQVHNIEMVNTIVRGDRRGSVPNAEADHERADGIVLEQQRNMRHQPHVDLGMKVRA